MFPHSSGYLYPVYSFRAGQLDGPAQLTMDRWSCQADNSRQITLVSRLLAHSQMPPPWGEVFPTERDVPSLPYSRMTQLSVTLKFQRLDDLSILMLSYLLSLNLSEHFKWSNFLKIFFMFLLPKGLEGIKDFAFHFTEYFSLPHTWDRRNLRGQGKFHCSGYKWIFIEYWIFCLWIK